MIQYWWWLAVTVESEPSNMPPFSWVQHLLPESDSQMSIHDSLVWGWARTRLNMKSWMKKLRMIKIIILPRFQVNLWFRVKKMEASLTSWELPMKLKVSFLSFTRGVHEFTDRQNFLKHDSFLSYLFCVSQFYILSTPVVFTQISSDELYYKLRSRLLKCLFIKTNSQEFNDTWWLLLHRQNVPSYYAWAGWHSVQMFYYTNFNFIKLCTCLQRDIKILFQIFYSLLYVKRNFKLRWTKIC